MAVSVDMLSQSTTTGLANYVNLLSINLRSKHQQSGLCIALCFAFPLFSLDYQSANGKGHFSSLSLSLSLSPYSVHR